MRRITSCSVLLVAAVAFAGTACDDDSDGESGPAGPAILTPAQLTFSVFCGAEAPTPLRFLATNAGDEALTISSVKTTGGFTVAAEVPFTVQPGATYAVTVTPPAPIVGIDSVGDTKRGTVVINSNDAQGAAEIQLFAEVNGGELAFETLDNKALAKVDFRSPNQLCPEPQSFLIVNKGSRSISIGEFGGSNPVEQVTDANPTIAPGKSLEFRVLANSSEGCVTAGSISFSTSGGSCETSVSLPVTQQINGSAEQCFCSMGEASNLP